MLILGGKLTGPSSTPPPNKLNFGPLVTKATSSSHVPQPMYEGEFAIISLSGSFMLSESNGNHGAVGGLGVLLSRQDNKVLVGVLSGMLTVVSPMSHPFFGNGSGPGCDFEQPKSKAPSSTPPPNLLNFGPPVTKAASSSQVPQPTFEGQAM
ncbi:hypothetical protein BC332_34160 [Capsicum chinense]|nr:hypothetical protein BC332_34160 [Capsicum chinense]